MNNIFQVWKPNNGAFYQIGGDAQFSNDLTNAPSSPEVGGIVGTPQYASGNGWQSGVGGMYQLAAGSPGYDKGKRIPNFNDGFLGAAPDVGAAEAGAPAMKFGIAAASATGTVPGSTGSTNTGGSTGGSSGHGGGNPVGRGGAPDMGPRRTIQGASTSGSGTAGGSVSVSSTMDSSSYTIGAGKSVTFTARVMGNAGAPTGSVSFQANSSTISGCGAIPLSGGQATCTTSSLGGGTYAITGLYSGDATYTKAVAGPITQTVTGGSASTAYRLTMDSSAYVSRAGQAVTFTAAVYGNSPTGRVDFQDNGVTIGSCVGIALSGGVATCTTSGLASGSHSIRGIYSGDSSNPSGIAGPITQTVQ
jgi:hypothetical protein